jgi:Gpi18-like mannosyltransferase
MRDVDSVIDWFEKGINYGKIVCRNIRIPQRLAIPLLVAAIVKISVYCWIQLSVNSRPDLFSFESWWEIFTIWDGGWYNLIATYWYGGIPQQIAIPAEQTFAFFPGFPTIIRGVGLAAGNFVLAQVGLAIVFGLLWIPLFQVVAEQYLSQKDALSSTVIAALFPTVFLFTSVGYSEGFFLTLILASWLFYLRKKPFWATIFATAAALTRVVGIIIIIPMILEKGLEKKYREAFVFLLPVLTQMAWFCYGYVKTGDFFVVFQAQEYWENRMFISQYVLPALFQSSPPYPVFNLPYTESFMGLVICLFGVFLLLVGKVFEVDWKLGVYSALTWTIIVLYGSILSYPRFLSFIFPCWLFIQAKRRWILVLIAAILGLCNVFFVYLFARWVFLG